MGKFGFALGTIAGMALVAANERERRAYELNEEGIRLCNNFCYESALDYFLEANKLMPNNEYILNNIDICKTALNRINNYQKQHSNINKTESVDKATKKNPNYINPHSKLNKKQRKYSTLEELPDSYLTKFFETNKVYFDTKTQLIEHANNYNWSDKDIDNFIKEFEVFEIQQKQELIIQQQLEKEELIKQRKFKQKYGFSEQELSNSEQKLRELISGNIPVLCDCFSIPNLGKKYVIDRIMQDYPVEEIVNKLKLYV